MEQISEGTTRSPTSQPLPGSLSGSFQNQGASPDSTQAIAGTAHPVCLRSPLPLAGSALQERLPALPPHLLTPHRTRLPLGPREVSLPPASEVCPGPRGHVSKPALPVSPQPGRRCHHALATEEQVGISAAETAAWGGSCGRIITVHQPGAPVPATEDTGQEAPPVERSPEGRQMRQGRGGTGRGSAGATKPEPTRLSRGGGAPCSHGREVDPGLLPSPHSVHGTRPTPTAAGQVNRRQMAEARPCPASPRLCRTHTHMHTHTAASQPPT